MKSCKKIVSCFLCIAILTSFLCVPASANDGIAGAAQDFFEWSVNWSQGIQNSFWKAIYGDSWMEDETGGWTGADRDELTARYNEYASSLQTDLGTATLIDGGIRVYLWPGSSWYQTSRVDENGTVFTDTAIYYSLIGTYESDTACYAMTKATGSIRAPFACHYSTGVEVMGIYNSVKVTGACKDNELIAKDSFIYFVEPNSISNWGAIKITVPYGVVSSGVIRVYADLSPVAGTLPTTQDITINSRPTSIVGDYGIIGDDGTIIHIEGNKIVNEDDSTVYNPVTDTTYDFTDYAFDYSDRSYLLTLEDGNTIKVVYGDENITIHEGDTIYNVYYMIPDDTGSGDDTGGDSSDDENWSWWKKTWASFTDKLFSVLGTGGSLDNDNVPSVPDDEETDSGGYSIIDLFVVLKDGTWSFITGIVSTAYDGFNGFVESVSSAGSFFEFYDDESEESIFFIPLEEGETVWD